MTPEQIAAISALIVALGGLLAALGGFVGALWAARNTARKSEVELLRGEVQRLSTALKSRDDQIEDQYDQIGLLREENLLLRSTLHKHGIEVPAPRRQRDQTQPHIRRDGKRGHGEAPTTDA